MNRIVKEIKSTIVGIVCLIFAADFAFFYNETIIHLAIIITSGLFGLLSLFSKDEYMNKFFETILKLFSSFKTPIK